MTSQTALAEILRHPLLVRVIERAKTQTGDARTQSLKTLLKALGSSADAYIAEGGPLADELAAHLPANDAGKPKPVAVRELDLVTGMSEKAPPRVSAAAAAKKQAEAEAKPAATNLAPLTPEKEPEPWLKPKVPKGAKGADFEVSVADARKAIAKYADDGSQIAFSIGWSKIPKGYSDADIDMLAHDLAEKMKSTQAKVKKLIARGVWKRNPAHIALEKKKERNSPRGVGFEFLEGTNYTLSDDQTMIGVNERRGDKEEFSAICGAFRVLGKVKDQDRGSWGLRISYKDHDGDEHQTTVSSVDWNGDPRALRSALGDQGFHVVPYAKFTLERLFADIMPRVENTLTTYSRPGWHDGRYVSVLGEVIGEDADSAVLSDRTGAEDREKKGTLAGWKLAANELAGDNDHWSIGLAAGFAGTLIDRCGLDTAAACISGPTSDGKTIALTLSASVHGNPKERAGVLHPLRVTASSIELLFERASGATISLDELALAEPRDVGAMLMLLASGSGKARMTKAISLGRMMRWRSFVLFSSERSLRNIVEGAKVQYLGGHAVRCVDIATTGARRHDPAAVRALGQKLRDNYGHAAPIFAAHLLAMGEAGEPGKLRERIAAAAKTFAGDQASPAQARAAHTFAVLAVAASIAEDAGLIDDAVTVTDALLRAWARYAAGDELRAADPVKEALSTLRDNLTTLRNHTLLPLEDRVATKFEKHKVKGKIVTVPVDPDDDEEATEATRFREPVGFYDKAYFYIRADKLVGLAGGVVKLDDLKKGLGDFLARRGKKHLTWQELPGKDPLSHYRLKVAFAVAEPGDDRD